MKYEIPKGVKPKGTIERMEYYCHLSDCDCNCKECLFDYEDYKKTRIEQLLQWEEGELEKEKE